MAVINQVTLPEFNSKGYYLPFAYTLICQKRYKNGTKILKHIDFKNSTRSLTIDNKLIDDAISKLCELNYISKNSDGSYTIADNILDAQPRRVFLNDVLPQNIYNDIILLTVIRNKDVTIESVSNLYEDRYTMDAIRSSFSEIVNNLHYLFELNDTGYYANNLQIKIKNNKLRRVVEYIENGGYKEPEIKENSGSIPVNIHYGDVVHGDKAGRDIYNSKNYSDLNDSFNNDNRIKTTQNINQKSLSENGGWLKKAVIWVLENIIAVAIVAIAVAYIVYKLGWS